MTDIANEEHRVILMKQGVKAWNAWRFKPEGFALDLAGADLALAARQTPAIPHDEFGHRTMNVVSPGRGLPPGRPAPRSQIANNGRATGAVGRLAA